MSTASSRPAPAALRTARTCYDHLAGALGVAVFDQLVATGAVIPPHAGAPARLGPAADAVFAGLGVDLAALRDRPGSARPLLRCCRDGTEHRPHLAGALGAAVLARALAADWVRRVPGGRAVALTAAGRAGFDAATPRRRTG